MSPEYGNNIPWLNVNVHQESHSRRALNHQVEKMPALWALANLSPQPLQDLVKGISFDFYTIKRELSLQTYLANNDIFDCVSQLPMSQFMA